MEVQTTKILKRGGLKMKTLMVSFDCGGSYEPFMESENVDELIKRTEKRNDPREDISFTRWYIEEDGKMDMGILCPAHKHIRDMMVVLNQK